MSIKINEKENITLKISLAPKGKCNYIFNKGSKQIKRFLNKDQPNALGSRTELYKYIFENSGDEQLSIKDSKIVLEEDFFITLQEEYNKLVAEQEDKLEKATEVKHDEVAAKFWEYHIHKFGLIPVLDSYLDYVHIGDHSNIYSKLLHGFGVITGEESFYQHTNASAEMGKSYEDEILYSERNVCLFPPEHVFQLNGITAAAFRNMCFFNPRIFDGKLVYAGDKGDVIDQELMTELKTIIKQLITDGFYQYSKDDGTGQSTVMIIKIEADSLAWIENSVLNKRKNDHWQEESRTNYYTIHNNYKSYIMDFRGELIANNKGKVYDDYKNAVVKLKSFQHFLRYKKEKHRKIYVPLWMRDKLKQRLLKNPVGIREFERHVKALQSFQELQSDSDSVDNATFEEYCKYFLNETSMNPLTNNLYIALTELLSVPESVEELLDNSVVFCNFCYRKYDSVLQESIPVPVEHFYELEEDSDITKSLKKLLRLYRLKNTGDQPKYFFTTSDLRHRLAKNKSYKNITDINSALETMKDFGFIDCLEEQVRINGNWYRIWYLLP